MLKTSKIPTQVEIASWARVWQKFLIHPVENLPLSLAVVYCSLLYCPITRIKSVSLQCIALVSSEGQGAAAVLRGAIKKLQNF